MRQSIEEYNDKYILDILDKMNKCDTVCTDLGNRPYKSENENLSNVDWLIEHLPSFNYVVDRMLNYMFSDGMATGDEGSDKTLDAWLFERKNKRGVTNYAELRECMRRSIGYGECGMRAFDGDIYHIPVGYYGRLVDRIDGIEQTILFYIRKDGERVQEKLDKTEWKEWKDYDDPYRWFDAKGYIMLDPDKDFMVLERNPGDMETKSPLLSDKERIDLLTAVYDQLNYDIRYDGPGRIFFRLKSGWAEGDENDISTGEVLGNTPEQRNERLDNAKKEVAKLMTEVKNSSSDSVGVLSQAFEDDYIHLPRVTKGIDFINWLANDTTIMAQVIGMSPTLLEVGKLHGNISVQHIIDNAMLNTIVPQREIFATQFSEFIGRLIGVGKVYFDKYNMAQVDNENDTRKDLALVVKDLSIAAHNMEGSPDIEKAITDVVEVLRQSLYDEANVLKKV